MQQISVTSNSVSIIPHSHSSPKQTTSIVACTKTHIKRGCEYGVKWIWHNCYRATVVLVKIEQGCFWGLLRLVENRKLIFWGYKLFFCLKLETLFALDVFLISDRNLFIILYPMGCCWKYAISVCIMKLLEIIF